MNSQVLYRKWRPQRLAEVVGQEPVTRTLKQALAQERVGHAYLFCGPRGTGKTTTARILAKGVNCPALQEGEPCNACSFCRAVGEGRALDLIEIDAASHRGIDDIRNIQEKVYFVPADGKRKVYIVDEAHMLTEHAFNALLKTLEEPPPHSIFVLCTTEPYKIPLTIASRCQRFDFRRISVEDIAGCLSQICLGEGIEAELDVLQAIARASSGSLRDACNLLEQLVTSYGGTISLSHVREMLGQTAGESAQALARAVLTGDSLEGLRVINTVFRDGKDVSALHRESLEYLRGAMLLKAGVHSAELSPEVAAVLRPLAQGAPWGLIVRAVRAFGQVNWRGDALSPWPLEVALLEAVQGAEGVVVGSEGPSQGHSPSFEEPSTVPQKGDLGSAPVGKARAAGKTLPDDSRPSGVVEQVHSGRAAPAPRVPPQARPEPAKEGVPSGVTDAQWDSLYKEMKKFKGRRYYIGSLLLDCKERRLEGESLVLVFRNRSNMERLKEEIEDPPTRTAVREAINKAFGHPYELDLRAQGNSSAQEIKPQGHLLRAAMALGGKVIEEEEELDAQ